MEIKIIHKIIKDKIAEGDTLSAIEVALSFSQYKYPKIENELLLYKSRIAKNSEEQFKGLITKEQGDVFYK